MALFKQESYFTFSVPKDISLIEFEPDSRYKVSQIQIVYEGNNKMKKTILTNIEKVAKQLLIPVDVLFYFLKSNCNATIKDDKYYYSGHIEIVQLSKQFRLLLKEIILCPKCNLPELVYSCNDPKKKLKRNCNSCGEQESFSSLDHSWIKIFKESLFKKF